MTRGAAQRAAWREFSEPIKRTIHALDQRAVVLEHDHGDCRIIRTPPDGIPLDHGRAFHFSLTLEHVVKAGEERMTTRRYDFFITQNNERVMAWHWHPQSNRTQVPWPHFHMPKGMPFSSCHIPTGRVSLEDVVLFVFDELGVPPALQHGREIVEQVRDTHKKHRGWS